MQKPIDALGRRGQLMHPDTGGIMDCQGNSRNDGDHHDFADASDSEGAGSLRIFQDYVFVLRHILNSRDDVGGEILRAHLSLCDQRVLEPVSYTHLTLPTIYS